MASYSARFLHAVRRVLDHEGGFVDHPNDPGGATNYGLSLRWLKTTSDLDNDGVLDGDLDHDGAIDIADVKAATKDDAVRLYHDYWWAKRGYDRLPSPVGEKVFDMAINMGSRQAERLLQRAINRHYSPPIAEDGVLGPNTLRAARAINPSVLTDSICDTQSAFYERLADQKPKLKVFLTGWLRRANAYHS